LLAIDFNIDFVAFQKAAMNACKEGLSVLTIVGVADLTAEVSYNPIQLIYGRTIKGTYFGGLKYCNSIAHTMDKNNKAIIFQGGRAVTKFQSWWMHI
jgi:Zn-dependent alcohol dehydrogenase